MNHVTAKLRGTKARNWLPFVAIAITAILIGFFAIRFMGNNKSYADGSSCKGICVNLTPNGMNPDELAVKAGEFVQFNSTDGQTHNISLGKGAGGHEDNHAAHEGEHEHTAAYASGDFDADEAWRVQFKTPGTYQLHDHYNPKQNILVIVY